MRFDSTTMEKLMLEAAGNAAKATAYALRDRIISNVLRTDMSHVTDSDGQPVDVDSYRNSFSVSFDPKTGDAAVVTNHPQASRIEYGDADTPAVPAMAIAISDLSGTAGEQQIAAKITPGNQTT